MPRSKVAAISCALWRLIGHEITAPMLETDSGVRHETIDSSQVHDMPLQGRNWVSLMKVVPGSNPTTDAAVNGREYGGGGFQDFAINGKNPRQTQVNLDGVAVPTLAPAIRQATHDLDQLGHTVPRAGLTITSTQQLAAIAGHELKPA